MGNQQGEHDACPCMAEQDQESELDICPKVKVPSTAIKNGSFMTSARDLAKFTATKGLKLQKVTVHDEEEQSTKDYCIGIQCFCPY